MRMPSRKNDTLQMLDADQRRKQRSKAWRRSRFPVSTSLDRESKSSGSCTLRKTNPNRLLEASSSYTRSGRIVLNVDLIRASPMLIDYVICHELTHAFHSD